MTVESIENGEALSSVRGKLNATIAASNKLTAPQSHLVYVSKVGDDANTGLSAGEAVLTIGQAVTVAETLIAADADAVRIEVMDGGTYTENVTLPANVLLFAAGATIEGTLAIAPGSEAFVDKIIATANNQKQLTMSEGGAGIAIAHVGTMDGRGFTGVLNIRNIGGGGRNFHVYAGIIFVGEDGIGVGDTTGGFGHIHIEVGDLYVAGDNAVGILGSASGPNGSNIIGWIDHILPIGGATSTIGISMTDANAEVKIVAAEIIAATAWNISAGDFYLVCPKVVGTQTGDPTNFIG